MKKAIKAIMSLILVASFMIPINADAAGFSGGSRSASGPSYSAQSGSVEVTPVRSRARTGGSSYRSGYRAPSSGVSKTPTTRPNTQTPPRTTGGFWKGAALFGAGTFIGSMLHPFGGGGYGGGFSFTSLLLDVLIIAAVIWFVKKIFTRKRRY